MRSVQDQRPRRVGRGRRRDHHAAHRSRPRRGPLGPGRLADAGRRSANSRGQPRACHRRGRPRRADQLGARGTRRTRRIRHARPRPVTRNRRRRGLHGRPRGDRHGRTVTHPDHPRVARRGGLARRVDRRSRRGVRPGAGRHPSARGLGRGQHRRAPRGHGRRRRRHRAARPHRLARHVGRHRPEHRVGTRGPVARCVRARRGPHRRRRRPRNARRAARSMEARVRWQVGGRDPLFVTRADGHRTCGCAHHAHTARHHVGRGDRARRGSGQPRPRGEQDARGRQRGAGHRSLGDRRRSGREAHRLRGPRRNARHTRGRLLRDPQGDRQGLDVPGTPSGHHRPFDRAEAVHLDRRVGKVQPHRRYAWCGHHHRDQHRSRSHDLRVGRRRHRRRLA